ncbi:MAG: hypothetical protein NC338_05760 [Firmicutes bacterium]|nr:hypothetical protein [Bacillota bacterium]MCM1401909.1 hypothetical protein [Bacteroides sp.]MCM1477911.1 hypothetical protein [Bacteroides sp.]
MNEALTITYEGAITPMDFKRLPSSMRMPAAERKYAEAVAMYAATELTVRSVAKMCGVSAIGLSAHIAKHHRALLFARYGLDINRGSLQTLKVKPSKGQSIITHLKYKDAIEACCDVAYIELNVSQIARLFKLDGSSLASQLRVHFPDVIPNREELRRNLGIADNTHRGPRKCCVEAYAEALEMYRDTDLTIAEVADKCSVSKSGFCQFMRYYHKEIIAEKSARRKAARKAVGVRRPGELAGNGNLYGPKPETVALYAPALELYRTSSLTVDEIISRTGVPAAGFKGYLHQWHRGDKLRRRGYGWDGESEPDLQGTRHFLKSTAAKYAPAIASLKASPRNVAEVAAEFGLNPETFREYLKTHEPELAARRGMARQSNGKLVKRASAEKYAQAIHEYATTSESLKSIAQRHGFVYNSLCGYVTRNCPEERESHRKILEAERLPAK